MKAALVALTAVTALPGSALAAWEKPQTVAEGKSLGAQAVAVAGNGDAVALWYADGTARAAVRSKVAKTFGPAVTVSKGGVPARLALAAGPDGRAAAVWEFRANRGEGVWLAERAPGGKWKAGAPLAALGTQARWPGIGIEPGGGLLATFWNGGPPSFSLRVGGGPFGATTTIAAAGEVGVDLTQAADPAGGTLVTWAAAGGLLRAAHRPPGGTFSAAETVPGPGVLSASSLGGSAVGSAGQSVVVQQRFASPNYTLAVNERPAGGVFGAPVVLGQTAQLGGFTGTRAAIDAAGNAIAAWSVFNGAHWVVQTSERAVGGAWSPATTLSGGVRDASRPALAVSRSGRALVAWQEKRGSTVVLVARARTATGRPFGATVTVGTSGTKRRGAPRQIASARPQVAFGPNSRGIAAWTSCFSGGCLIQAAREK